MNTIRRIFLIVFILSALAMLMSFAFSLHSMAAPAPVTENPGAEPTSAVENNPSAVDPNAQDSNAVNYTALVGSVTTSIISLIGFITTTVITWRKEKREASLADVERKKLETELEKSKFELEKLKKGKRSKK